MKIYDRDLTGASAAESSRAQETQRTGRETSSASRAGSSAFGDRVELSSGLGQLSRALSNFGADRSSRVESLSAIYQSGGYRPDTAATSRAMVTDALATEASA